MTSLADTLPALSAAVPEIGARLDGLLRLSEHVLRTAEDALAQVKEKRAEAATLSERADEVLEELSEAFRQHERAVIAGGGEVATAVDTALTNVDEAREAVSQAADAAEAARVELHREAAEAGPTLQTLEQDVRGGLDQLGDTLQAGEGELTAAMQAVVAETEGLRTMLEEQRGELASATDALKQRLSDALEHAKQGLASLESDVESWQREHDTHLGGEATRLVSAREEAVKDVEERLDTEVRDAVSAGVADALVALQALDGVAAEATSDLESGRQSVAAYFDALSEAMQPLPAAVEAVRKAVGELGLAWD
jgi:chromosome segregation ATPase